MQDGPVRRAVKRAALAVFSVSLWVSRRHAASSGDLHYELGGECRRSGRCCEAPAMRVSWLVWYAPFISWLFLKWQQNVNGFVLVEKRRRERTFVFHCTHFDRNSRLCDSYGSRPGMCRDYPLALIYQPAPEFFPDCGYKALSPKRQELLQALKAKPLDDQQMKKLKKGLYLE